MSVRGRNTNPQPNHRILVIDDNVTIHADFRKILSTPDQGHGGLHELEAALFDEVRPTPETVSFELGSAYQGQEGLEMVRKAVAEDRPYAVAFVDVRMPPGWDGIETIAHIWEVDPEIQIVVCTAYSDYSWEELRAKVGNHDSLVVLKKPFDNVEVQQLAYALTKKWLLNLQAGLKLNHLETLVQERTAELAQANRSLSMSEERFSKAFHSSPVPSAILTVVERRFVDVNARLAEICGWSRDQMIGRTPAGLCLWEKPELEDQWFQSLGQQESVQDEEANIHDREGGLHEVLVSLAPVALRSESHVLLLAQDVSERVRLERQLRQAQKMEAIGQLAAGVAHDFNNILTVIQGHAGLMQCSLDTTGPQSKSLGQILEASNRAAKLIRQLLMFSRKQVMQLRRQDPNETLRNAIGMVERLVGEHVEIDFRPQEPIPAINADASMVEQIAMNLAANARDAMPNGGRFAITTTFETIHRAPTPLDSERRDGEYVCLTFSDNGTGMDKRVLGRIFEPFFTTKGVGKGTGLGLSTVFGIVRQHQGWLEVESEPGQGSTFRVYLPAINEAPEKREAVKDETLRSGGETILVAEDEAPLRDLVVQVLKMKGYHVLAASSGREALEVWNGADRPIDLLVTDMVMPGGIMGRELAERLVQRRPDLKVIYTSGYSPGMAGQDSSLLEGGNFLPKPYPISAIVRLVRECLDAPVGATPKRA